jgi:hypothetical protein
MFTSYCIIVDEGNNISTSSPGTCVSRARKSAQFADDNLRLAWQS